MVKGFGALMQEVREKLQRMGHKLGERRASGRAYDEELFVERTGMRPFVLSVLFTALKLMLVLVVLIGCAGVGLVLGIAKAYVDTTPELDIAQLTKSDRTSYIYDSGGKLITTFAGIEYRDWVEIDEVPDMLINAVVAIEDVRFYKHDGVDYKRLFAAVVDSLSASGDAGGSTITQQLVKNKLLTNEVSYKRKIQEAYLALEIEDTISKREILEAYLNDVYLGGSNYGVKTAAKDYFGKELSDLSIRECAMLAGMVQNPSQTNPRLNTYSRFYDSGEKAGRNKMDITDSRTDKVINRMYSAGFITKEQRETALSDTVYILETSEKNQIYDMPYFVEYAIRDVITHLLEKRGLLDTTANRTAIENELKTGGYSIYLTVDTRIQHIVQDTLENYEDYPELENPSANVTISTNADVTTVKTVQPQAAAVVFDYHSGNLVAIVGGRTAPTVKKGLNRAYQSAVEVGSSIKPIAVYGPALDLGMSPASIIANIPAPIDGWNTETGYPAIGEEAYIGPVTMRRAIISSLNVAAARTLMEYVTPQVSAQYLANLGIDPSRISETGSGLALGTTGITPIEMAAAFGAIAAGGEYKEPLSFSRVVDDEGRVILSADEVRETRQVFKTSTAYMLVDMLTEAVQKGTGTRARIDHMTVAGKTGTNSDYASAFFAGMTPYYSAVVWVGHDDYEQKLEKGSTGGKAAAPLWQKFMGEIHEGLINKPILDVSPVEEGLVQRTVCAVSGKLATEACQYDANGRVPVTEWFEKSKAPTEKCDMHVLASVCTISGEPASAYCPAEAVQTQSIVLINPASQFGKYDPEIVKKYIKNAVFTDATADQYGLVLNMGTLCSIHTPAWARRNPEEQYVNLVERAVSLIDEVNGYLAAAQNLPDVDRRTLEDGVSALEYYLEAGMYGYVETSVDKLRYNFDVIYEENPPVVQTP